MREPKVEFSGVRLGDSRLDGRLLQMVDDLADDPSQSFPDAFGRGAPLEGGYRLLNNARVTPEAIIAPHVENAARRVHERGAALLVHDTTELRFPGERDQLAKIQSDQWEHGFLAHYTVAVSADGLREPLGVVTYKTWQREEKRADAPKESARWLEQSIAAEKIVGPGPRLVHVEDREADITECIAQRLARGMRFIIRAKPRRKVVTEAGNVRIDEVMRSKPRAFEREVPLSKRSGIKQRGKSHQQHLARDKRLAKLEVAAARVELINRTTSEGPILVNAVHIVEVDPPEGAEPVEWLLLTSEPIETNEEIAFIIDSYRARWTIEEYFKALKTGCAYEKRQLESYGALTRALAIFSVLACRLLWLRFLAHHSPDEPATTIATEAELAVLRARRYLKSETIAGFLDGVAALGGHLKHNGKPGWQTLWRGARKLELLAEGWALRDVIND